MNDDWKRFKLGDTVTCGGADRHRIIAIAEDVIDIECIQPPLSGWCKVGDREHGMAWRYRFAETIDASMNNHRSVSPEVGVSDEAAACRSSS